MGKKIKKFKATLKIDGKVISKFFVKGMSKASIRRRFKKQGWKMRVYKK